MAICLTLSRTNSSRNNFINSTPSRGQYWRAKNAIPEQRIEQDEVLLIESLRWVDNALHTVILRTHPSKFDKNFVFKFTDAAGRSYSTTKSFKEHRFLFDDFLDKFEFADDGQEIRGQELLAAQNRVSQLTQQMTDTMSDPDALRTELLGRIEAKKPVHQLGDEKNNCLWFRACRHLRS